MSNANRCRQYQSSERPPTLCQTIRFTFASTSRIFAPASSGAEDVCRQHQMHFRLATHVSIPSSHSNAAWRNQGMTCHRGQLLLPNAIGGGFGKILPNSRSIFECALPTAGSDSPRGGSGAFGVLEIYAVLSELSWRPDDVPDVGNMAALSSSIRWR